MRKLPFSLIAISIFLSVNISAQEVRGRVSNESGDNAGGVFVWLRNKNNTITKTDGTFRISVTKLPDTLFFSAAGFETYKKR